MCKYLDMLWWEARANNGITIFRLHSPFILQLAPLPLVSTSPTATYRSRRSCSINSAHSVMSLRPSFRRRPRRPSSATARKGSLPCRAQALRSLVLSHLAELESRLEEIPLRGTEPLNKAMSDSALEWLKEGTDIISSLKAEVSSRLPELGDALSDISHDLSSRLPDMPNFSNMRSHLPDLDLDIQYISTLSSSLSKLHAHLASLQLPAVSHQPPLL